MIERVSKIGVVGVGDNGRGGRANLRRGGLFRAAARHRAGAAHRGWAGASKNEPRPARRTRRAHAAGPGRDALNESRRRRGSTPSPTATSIVEAVLERFDLKKAVIGELDAVCRADAIFATDTSSISVTRLAATSKFPGRVVGMRFFNPSPITQVVEIISALQTTDETAKTIVQTDRDDRQKGAAVEGTLRLRREGPRANDQRGDRLRPRRPRLARARRLGANHPMGRVLPPISSASTSEDCPKKAKSRTDAGFPVASIGRVKTSRTATNEWPKFTQLSRAEPSLLQRAIARSCA